MYRPPEALNYNEAVDGKPCDMWSFGIMAIEILADFFLAYNLPPSQRIWHLDVYPTLYEILQEHCFTMYFDMTFMKDQMSNANKDARFTLDFVHGCLRMDPSKRATSFESNQHPFLIGGSDAVNAPDDIWKNEIPMGATEFEEPYVTSFNGGCFTKYVPQRTVIRSINGQALKSTNKCAEENEIPVSEKIRNLLLKIKEVIGNFEMVEQENAQKEEDNIPISKKIQKLRLIIKDLIEKSAGDKKKEIADKVYCQKEEYGLREGQLTQELEKGLDTHSKGFVEDFMTGSKPISVAAAPDSSMSILPPSKHSYYEKTNFESFDVSSEYSQGNCLKLDLDKQTSAGDLSGDLTPLKTRERRKRFFGWIQSKCLCALMFCCTTTENSDDEEE